MGRTSRLRTLRPEVGLIVVGTLAAGRTYDEYIQEVGKPAFSGMLVDAEGNLRIEEYRLVEGRSVAPDPEAGAVVCIRS